MERIPESKMLPKHFPATDKVPNLHGTLPRAEMAARIHFPVDSCSFKPIAELERVPDSKTLSRQFPAADRVGNSHGSVLWRADAAQRMHSELCNVRHQVMERLHESKMLPRQFDTEKVSNSHGAAPRMEAAPKIHFPMDSCHVKHLSDIERNSELKIIPGKLQAQDKVHNLHGAVLKEEGPVRIQFPIDSSNIKNSLEMERIAELKPYPGAATTGETAPFWAQKPQKPDAPVLVHVRKGKGSFQEPVESMPEVVKTKANDICDECGPSSFSGAIHPPEPVDNDLMRTVYVAIDKDKPERCCLVKSLSVKGPFLEDLSIRVPGIKPSASVLENAESTVEESNEIEASRLSSPFLVPCASQTTENIVLPHDSVVLPHDSEEKECVWDASLPPSGNVSPHSSIDSTGIITAMSVVNSCTGTYRSDGIASDGMLSMERNCESAKGSVIGDSLESAKTSISRASDSSGLSDESNWSNITGSANKPHKGNDPRWKAILAVRARDGVLGMNHFRLLRRLGCGDIGSVYLSELSGTRCYFAMKVMDKASLATRKKLNRAQTEREILQLLDHPFLPTLYTHFDTDRFSCLVMEFCPGGDLHTLRQRQPGKYFPEYAARFYAAEVLLALEYLHMLGVVYRDLKPENVLVRDDGHIMLSDFDLSLRCAVSPTLIKTSSFEADPSKRTGGAFCVQPVCMQPSSVCIQPSCFMPRIFPQKGKKKGRKPRAEPGQMLSTLPELVAEPTAARSMSFVGTHEYLAPEIIKGEGHGSAVDWWTFGVFLHELLYGKTPFKGSGNRATLFNVVGQQLRFPDSPTTSYSSRDLIRGLLVKQPQHRLGVKRGATEIKQHPFFEGVNWALIRCSTPPEVPRPVEAELPGKLGPGEGVGVGSSSKRMVGADTKAGGKYLDFEFF